MPNFDALRSAISGPLSYICRPKLPPPALCGCWPLGVNDLSDKSRYSGSFLSGGTASWNTSYSLPLIKPSSCPLTFNLGQGVSEAQDFAIEYMFLSTGPDTIGPTLTFGDFQLIAFRDSGGAGYMGRVRYGTTDYNITSLKWSMNVLNHIAFFRLSGTYYYALNGVVKTVAITFNPTTIVNSAAFTIQTGNYAGICNFRFCQAAVGTATAYPVPATLYTGYEPL